MCLSVSVTWPAIGEQDSHLSLSLGNVLNFSLCPLLFILVQCWLGEVMKRKEEVDRMVCSVTACQHLPVLLSW